MSVRYQVVALILMILVGLPLMGLLIYGSFWIGNMMGKAEGVFLAQRVDVGLTLTTLEFLREGDPEGAIELLEIHLDGEAMLLTAGAAIHPKEREAALSMVRDIRAYQERHPPPRVSPSSHRDAATTPETREPSGP